MRQDDREADRNAASRPKPKPKAQRPKIDTSKMSPQERVDYHRKQRDALQKRKDRTGGRNSDGEDGSAGPGGAWAFTDTILLTKANSDLKKAETELAAYSATPAQPGSDAAFAKRGAAERPQNRRRKGRAKLRIDSQTGGVSNDGGGNGVNVPQK